MCLEIKYGDLMECEEKIKEFEEKINDINNQFYLHYRRIKKALKEEKKKHDLAILRMKQNLRILKNMCEKLKYLKNK
ncbi:MAG: hypothetical protein ACPL1F_03360 [bacterium]